MSEASFPDLQFRTSPELKDFLGAFDKAKDSMGAVIKDSQNPHLKNRYASLSAVSDVVEPAIQSAGLTLIQAPFGVGDRTGVLTTIFHGKSGQWMQCALGLKPQKADPQGDGSAITYARRYSLVTLFGLKVEDDDGEAASGRPANDARHAERDEPGGRQTAPRVSSAQAKRDGTWELLTGELALCRNEEEVKAWGVKHAATIKGLPRKWYDALAEERGKHLKSLSGPMVEALDTPDDNFPPDWEKWRARLALAITEAPDADTIDAIWAANGAGLAGLGDVFADGPGALHEHAQACKQRLADKKAA